MLWKIDEEIKGNYFQKTNTEQFQIQRVDFWSVKSKDEPSGAPPSLPLTSTEAQWCQKPPEQPKKQVDVAD